MSSVGEKGHAVCIPAAAQSHIKAMLKLAKLLHSKGIHITFVNTEFNHKRFLKSGGSNSLDGSPDFRFETIPDGLPPSNDDATQDITALCLSIRINCLAPFLELLTKLNTSSNIPPVTCIVSDGFMTFTIDAAQQLGIPVVLFWTFSASGFMGFYQLHNLLEKGLTPLKGLTSVATDGGPISFEITSMAVAFNEARHPRSSSILIYLINLAKPPQVLGIHEHNCHIILCYNSLEDLYCLENCRKQTEILYL